MESSQHLSLRRIVDATAIMLIGCGVLGALLPVAHLSTWLSGPPPWRAGVRFFADRPRLTRVVSALTVCATFWWARQHLDES